MTRKALATSLTLYWGSETRTRIWHGSPNHGLIRQNYSGKSDYANYFHYLLPFLHHTRYLKIFNSPLHVRWQLSETPSPCVSIEPFNQLAGDYGFNDMDMIETDHWHEQGDLMDDGFDRIVSREMPMHLNSQGNGSSIWDLEVIQGQFLPLKFNEQQYPGITHDWGNASRSAMTGKAFENNHKDLIHRQIRDALAWPAQKTSEKMSEQILVIKAWNEWAKGSHLKADCRRDLSHLPVLHKTLKP